MTTPGQPTYKKYARLDQQALAVWAGACAERVLPFFEQACPQDGRPRQALAACRAWARTGIFHMAKIRAASLGAHAAARQVKENEAACFAARAAGQAVATAHVAQHACGAAYYALKALAARHPENAAQKVAEELDWQSRRLPPHLRAGVIDRLIVQQQGSRITIKIRKGSGF
jgi:hypothetical protein